MDHSRCIWTWYSKINQAFVDDFIVFEPNNETPQNNYALPRGMLS